MLGCHMLVKINNSNFLFSPGKSALEHCVQFLAACFSKDVVKLERVQMRDIRMNRKYDISSWRN